MAYPLSWLRAFPEGRDPVVVAALRGLGVLSLGLFGVALLGAFAIVDALSGPDSGWEGLIVGAAIAVGGGALLVGGVLAVVAHVGSVRYRESGDARLMGPTGIALTLLGGAAWLPWLLSEYRAPLDLYVGVLGLLVGLLGALLAWRVSRSRSRPA